MPFACLCNRNRGELSKLSPYLTLLLTIVIVSSTENTGNPGLDCVLKNRNLNGLLITQVQRWKSHLHKHNWNLVGKYPDEK